MNVADMRVSGLFVHPLKGARPVAVSSLELDELGAIGDRRCMLVDDDGVVITPRDTPRLAQITALYPVESGVIVSEAPLQLSIEGAADIEIWPHAHSPAVRMVRCWNDTLEMADAGDSAARWCSDAIGRSCRVMYMLPTSRRPLQAKYAGPVKATERFVSVTDGAPLLLLGEQSVAALNERLLGSGSAAVPSSRFRPNVLLSGGSAHDEDTWSLVRIGNVELGVGSQCVRCVVTTLDVESLTRSAEPLRTFAEYRRGSDGGVVFGMNATHVRSGTINLHDTVTVLATKATSS
jgi:uncharacterized protein YcbX